MVQKVLPNGETVTAYPITIPQQFMFGCVLKYGHGALVNNIGSGYYWQGGMDFDIMKKSIYEAIGRCETMRLRFTKDETYRVLQYIPEKTEMEIETLDFSDISLEEAHEKLLEISHGPAPMFDDELHIIKLVKLADNYNGFMLKLQHLAMDAYSTKVFLNDIMEIYLHYVKGTPYPKPMRSYEKALAYELAYLYSDQHEKEREYWYNSIAKDGEPIFTDYLLESRLKKQREKQPGCRYCDIHNGSPEAGVKVFPFTKEETDKVVKTCENNGFSICAFLSMGVRTALSAINDNEEDVSFKTIINRRGTLLEKKSGGMRINFFPLRTVIAPDKTYRYAVSELERVQNEIYTHCSLPFMEMLEVRHKSMPETALPDSTYDSVGFSYQPYMPVPNVDEAAVKSSKGVWYNNGASMNPLYITAKHRSNDGGIDFVYEYQVNPDPRYDIEIFFRIFHDTIMAGIENPDMTVGDLLDRVKITDEERNGK